MIMIGTNLSMLHCWILLLLLLQAFCFDYAQSQELLELFNFKPPFVDFNKDDHVTARIGRYVRDVLIE